MTYNTNRGNAIAEYGLIGCLVIGVCLAGLSLLGNNLQLGLDDFQRSLVRNNSGSAQIANTGQAATQNSSGQSAGQSTDSMLPQANLPSQLTSQQIAETIMVAGARGAMDELLGSMESYAQQFEAEGKITDEQANLLKKLANQGHQLAQAQRVLEDSILQGKTSVVYEGKNYTITEFADSIGFTRQGGKDMLLNLGVADTYSNLQPFASVFQEVKQSNVLNDPAVGAKITDLIFQIGIITDTLHWTAMDMLVEKPPAEHMEARFKASTLEHYVLNMGDPELTVESIQASLKTDKNSGKICQEGSGRDSGKNCS